MSKEKTAKKKPELKDIVNPENYDQPVNIVNVGEGSLPPGAGRSMGQDQKPLIRQLPTQGQGGALLRTDQDPTGVVKKHRTKREFDQVPTTTVMTNPELTGLPVLDEEDGILVTDIYPDRKKSGERYRLEDREKIAIGSILPDDQTRVQFFRATDDAMKNIAPDLIRRWQENKEELKAQAKQSHEAFDKQLEQWVDDLHKIDEGIRSDATSGRDNFFKANFQKITGMNALTEGDAESISSIPGGYNNLASKINARIEHLRGILEGYAENMAQMSEQFERKYGADFAETQRAIVARMIEVINSSQIEFENMPVLFMRIISLIYGGDIRVMYDNPLGLKYSGAFEELLRKSQPKNKSKPKGGPSDFGQMWHMMSPKHPWRNMQPMSDSERERASLEYGSSKKPQDMKSVSQYQSLIEPSTISINPGGSIDLSSGQPSISHSVDATMASMQNQILRLQQLRDSLKDLMSSFARLPDDAFKAKNITTGAGKDSLAEFSNGVIILAKQASQLFKDDNIHKMLFGNPNEADQARYRWSARYKLDQENSNMSIVLSVLALTQIFGSLIINKMHKDIDNPKGRIQGAKLYLSKVMQQLNQVTNPISDAIGLGNQEEPQAEETKLSYTLCKIVVQGSTLADLAGLHKISDHIIHGMIK